MNKILVKKSIVCFIVLLSLVTIESYAQKTIQNYVTISSATGGDSAVIIGVPYDIANPYMIASGDDIVPYNPDQEPPKDHSHGEIPYKLETTSAGQVHVNIPINSFVTEHEFGPQLSLDYNSGRNSFDVLGKGWIVKGLPVISREGKNYYTDGEVSGVSLTDNYTFTLDGERLIYQGESVDTVRFIGQTSDIRVLLIENNRFNVLYPDGSIATMTNTDGINYCITSLKNKDGQVIYYEYSDPCNCGNGHLYISRILYGGGKRMIFDYIRTDTIVEGEMIDHYCAGKQFNLRTKLKFIRIYSPGVRQPELIARYQLLSNPMVDNPLEEVKLIFNGGKTFYPIRMSYLYQSPINSDEPYQYEGAQARLSEILQGTAAKDCILQRGNFMHDSEGGGFIMFKNLDSYCKINGKYQSQYDDNGKILVIHNTRTEPNSTDNYVPCSHISMGKGFVDAFPANTNGVHGEEIVRINNWIQTDGQEQLWLNIYSANNNAISLINSINASDSMQNESVPMHPKTFLVGDFDGDGKTELLVVQYNDPNNSSAATSFRLLGLGDGIEKMRGSFNEHLKVFFPYNGISDNNRRLRYKSSHRVFAIDYNGDGKIEVGTVSDTGLKVYEFFHNWQGNITMMPVISKGFPSLSDLQDYDMRVGEFNGDGIADFLFMLDTDNINTQEHQCLKTYLGDGIGNFFAKDSIAFNYSCFPENAIMLPNRNGMTDIVVPCRQFNFWYPDGIRKLKVYMMRNGKFYWQSIYSLPEEAAIVPSSFYGESIAGGILAVEGDSTLHKYSELLPVDATWKMAKLVDTHHNKCNFTYSRVYENDDYHPDFLRYNFPFSTVSRGQWACHTIKKYDSDNNLVEDKLFSYGNAVMHEQGWGYLGFDSIMVTEAVSDRIVTNSYDPDILGAPTRHEDYLSINSFTNTLTVTSQKRLLTRTTQSNHYNKATGQSYHTEYDHDAHGNIIQASTTHSDGTIVNVNTQYLNHVSDSIIIIGLPQLITSTTTGANGTVVTGMRHNYNAQFLPVSEIKLFGLESMPVSEKQYTYDSRNRVISERERRFNSPWLTTTYSYQDESRNPVDVVDSKVWQYHYTYGKFGVTVISELEPQSMVIDPITPAGPLGGNEVNGNGGSIPIGDPDPVSFGTTTSRNYDEAGNVTSVMYPSGINHFTTRSWIYGSYGLASKYYVTDSITGQPVTRIYYNSLGQKTREETQRPDSTFLKVDYEYDPLGRLVKQYEPYKENRGLYTEFTYDAFDRLVCKTYPDGRSDTYSYSGLTTTSSVDGIISSRTVDALGNVVAVTDDGGTITYSMAPDGRPLSVTVNGEVLTTFEYDTYGRRTAINDPSAGRTSYTYDAAGNVATVTDARGNVTATTFNEYGLPTSAIIGGDMTVTCSYNNYLQPTSISCSNGNSKQFTYNKFHQLTSEAINGFKKSYNYSGGNVVSVNYKLNGENLGTETYQRTRGTLTGITFRGKSLWQLCAEDDRGLPTSLSSGVGTASLEYDDMKRVTRRIVETDYGTIHDMSYTYDTYGNLTCREDSYWGMVEDFDYDDLNRLVSTPAGDVTYDGKGNITALDGAGGFGYASSHPYALNQISLSGSAFPTAEQHITFNAMNRPDTITEGGITARLKYFEDGSRSAMTVAGNDRNNHYHYCGDQLTTITINQLGYEGEKQILFVGGDAYTAPAALVREQSSSASDWSQQLYYIVRDNLGSITHVVDTTGMVVQELSYDAWGRLRAPDTQQPYAPGESPSLLLGRGYCGHEHLPEFNLLNMNARLYDPWTARFLSPDPYVQLPDFTQSFNRYSYCLNNPLKLVDLTGKRFDYSSMSGKEYANYVANINVLLNNRLFRYYYNKLKESDVVYHIKIDTNFERLEEYETNDALYVDTEKTIFLGPTFSNWALSEEFYHAYQDYNNFLHAPYNIELEANFVAFLTMEGKGGAAYSSFENRYLDYCSNYKYGDISTDELITYDKIDVIIQDYLDIGQTFIYERPDDKHYTVPVTSFPELLLKTLISVYKNR